MIKIFLLTLTFGFISSKTYSQNNGFNEKDKFHNLNTSILDLYKQFPIVAIGEGNHNSALTFEWLSTLIHEEEFPIVINNVVVEFGASEYQRVMDDFVNDKDVPNSLFQKCWRETTQIMVWDSPIYEHFFREIKEINKGLPEGKRIRVLLGDQSFGSKGFDDEHVFHIIENEVLEKNQTALLIYGDLHFVKKDVFTNYAPAAELKKEFMNVIQFLEINHPNKAFSIWGSVNTTDSLTTDILAKEHIEVPSLISTANSELGEVDFRVFYPYPTGSRSDAFGNDIEESQHIQMPIKHIVDGIIYRGTWKEQNYLAPRPDHIYADTVYLNELIRREKIVNIPPYRTRLYFYKIFGSQEFLPLENALLTDNNNLIDSLYDPLKLMVPTVNRMDVLNHTGYFYLRKNEVKKAIAVFKLAIREYPDHFTPYDSLGDAFLANNEIEMAIQYFEEALKRNPDSKFIKDKLNKARTK